MICNLCPRGCNAERGDEKGNGYCKMPALPVVARAALHPWEEPPISGTKGSGTVFFSGCSLGCVFCQNKVISHDNFGKAIPVGHLREIFLALVAQGAHNINLVNPTHFTHAVAQALEEPLPVPVVWNSGGYDKETALRTLAGKVQVYLPDLKYLDADAAGAYSAAPDYPKVATAAIREMVRQTGPYELDGDGLMKKGVIIRHLILPGRVEGAKAVMDWVAQAFPPHTVMLSLMSQYTPWGKAKEIPTLNRTLRQSEIRSAEEYFAALDLDGFTQELLSATEGFIPAFDLTGV